MEFLSKAQGITGSRVFLVRMREIRGFPFRMWGVVVGGGISFQGKGNPRLFLSGPGQVPDYSP